MPPPLPVECLGPPPAPPVQLAVVLGRVARREELRFPQQRLDRLASGQQGRHQLALLSVPAMRAAARLAGGATVGHASTPYPYGCELTVPILNAQIPRASPSPGRSPRAPPGRPRGPFGSPGR